MFIHPFITLCVQRFRFADPGWYNTNCSLSDVATRREQTRTQKVEQTSAAQTECFLATVTTNLERVCDKSDLACTALGRHNFAGLFAPSRARRDSLAPSEGLSRSSRPQEGTRDDNGTIRGVPLRGIEDDGQENELPAESSLIISTGNCRRCSLRKNKRNSCVFFVRSTVRNKTL